MLEIKGKYTTATVYTDTIEDSAYTQIKTLCDQEFCKDSKVRIMPDVHAGIGCVIGFSANLSDMVIPNIVGVDIGCGMMSVALEKIDFSYEELDEIIKKFVPSGKNIHEGRVVKFPKLLEMNCYRNLTKTKRIEASIGTLGGGNHFIEVDIDEEGNKYLIIHTGSRNLGKQVADYYQNLAYELMRGKEEFFDKKEALIKKYKEEGRRGEIEEALKELLSHFKEKEIDIPKNLCYLKGKYRKMYLHDMKICQEYASLNRITIANIILGKLFQKSINDFSHFETIHNYIDLESDIVRKGAVSAKKGEKILIPINMKEGSLICIGKGNPQWNYSAPHGAGRLFSRMTAKEKFTLDEFKESMEGIFTTSVGSKTLDECPMAYKDISQIINNIGPTANIIKQIKPVYNFKASD